MPVQTLRRLAVLLVAALIASACRAEEAPPAPTAQVREAAKPLSKPDPNEAGPKRSVAREVDVVLRAKLAGEVVTKLTELTESQGGYVVSSEVNASEPGTVGAELTLRVPAAKLEPVILQLRKLGEVRREVRKGEDVTSEVVDIDARLVARRALEKRLLELLSNARSIEDMLKVEAELARVRLEIEQLVGQQRTLSQRTEFALVHVSIESPEVLRAAAESFASRFGHACRSALSTSQSVILGFIEFLGGIVPLAVIGALIALPIRVLLRRARLRRAALLATRDAGTVAPRA